MAYSIPLANRVRKRLSGLSHIEEKEMMGGLTFMYNGKMCIGIIADELMCRIDPELHDAALMRKGCRVMDFTGRPMKGYVMVSEAGMQNDADFDHWIKLCTDFNTKARSSKKKK